MKGRTTTLGAVSLILVVLCMPTDGLTCTDCTYSKVPDVLTDFVNNNLPGFDPADAFGSTVCRDGGDALMSEPSVNSTVCEEPASGKKAVCMQGAIEVKAMWDWSKVGGEKYDLTMTMYRRGCVEVDAGEPDAGSVPASEFEKNLKEAFEDDESGESSEEESPITIEFSDFRGKGVYCSTDSCGADQENISLDGVKWSSGVAAFFPSMLLVSAVALLARFF